MIFVTVGSMFPFDRLVRGMDEWARQHPECHVLAQTGDGIYEPGHMEWVRRLSPRDFVTRVEEARLIVAHAGTGSVITASDCRKPIVIMPRLAALGEHTTNHQVDTAGWLTGRPGLYVAAAAEELGARIEEALAAPLTDEMLPPHADPKFLERIRAAILR